MFQAFPVEKAFFCLKRKFNAFFLYMCIYRVFFAAHVIGYVLCYVV